MEKNSIISMKLNELEKMALDRLAAEEGVNRSELLRGLLQKKVEGLTGKRMTYIMALKKIATGRVQ